MYRSTKIITAMVAVVSVAFGFAVIGVSAAPLAHAATCVINGPGGGPCPQLGYYYPSPTSVQLPSGSGFTRTIVLEAVTDYTPQPAGTVPTAFMVEFRYTAQQDSTITCESGGTQIVPSDTHMNLYLNGTDTGYVAAYKSTCGDNPAYNVTLAPGQSAYGYVEFHFTPHPGNQISISQFSDSTPVFLPYGSMVRIPYTSPLSPGQLTADINYVSSFLGNLVNIVSETTAEDLTSLLTDLEGCLPDGFTSCAKDVTTIYDAITALVDALGPYL